MAILSQCSFSISEFSGVHILDIIQFDFVNTNFY